MLSTPSKLFALVDCNNFFVSCERVFNPGLIKRPVIVLSNNDGCVIARSNEAKVLGIKMGQPYFEVKALCDRHQVTVFSSNFELYGDFSRRIMRILLTLCPDGEIYSVDEAFLRLDLLGLRDPLAWAQTTRALVYQWTGIPISIGLGPTKTLAKVANTVAKRQQGIYSFTTADCLKSFPLKEIWGVGVRLAEKLIKQGYYSAWDLAMADPKVIRKNFTVMGERLVWELQGHSCLDSEDVSPKQSIRHARSFGKPLKEREDLEEAVSHYVATAAQKLRKHKQQTSLLWVYIRNCPYHPREAYYHGAEYHGFPYPTADTPTLIKAARQLVQRLYRPGHLYRKAGVVLYHLTPEGQSQLSLLDPPPVSNRLPLLKTIDVLNQRLGEQAVFFASQGLQQPWRLAPTNRSPRYTTRWDELMKVG